MSITYLEAIREAQAKALAQDPRVFIYGQDVGAFGGAFKATKNLAKEFPGRVLDAPISEDAMAGLAIGVAIDDPVIFCEHKFLYYHLKADSLPTEALPVGKARIARVGRDMTIVTYSAMVHEALAAADELKSDGWEVEIVDLRCVKPLDTD